MYEENGIYTVTVQVSDDDRAVGAATLKVQVNNVAPTVLTLAADSFVPEGGGQCSAARSRIPADSIATT